jgi:hypothetical protein
MDEFEKYTWTQCEWIIFNNWRLYFQVFTLSHITNHAGNQNSAHFLFRNKLHEWKPTSKYIWPHQKQPPIGTFQYGVGW